MSADIKANDDLSRWTAESKSLSATAVSERIYTRSLFPGSSLLRYPTSALTPSKGFPACHVLTHCGLETSDQTKYDLIVRLVVFGEVYFSRVYSQGDLISTTGEDHDWCQDRKIKYAVTERVRHYMNAREDALENVENTRESWPTYLLDRVKSCLS